MKYCNHCGAEIEDEAVVCVKCGCKVAQNNKELENPKEATAVYGVLGFLIPVVGLILFLIWRNDYPRRSKTAGIAALISFILSFVVGIVYGIIVVSVLGSAM